MAIDRAARGIAAHSSATALRQGGQPFTAVSIGNSLSALDAPYPFGGYQQLLPTSLFGQINYQLNQRFLLLNVAGVGGEKISQILARFDAAVTPYNPGYVFAYLLENDAAAISNTATTAEIAAAVASAKTYVQAFVSKCFAINATPILFGLTPSAAQITGVGRASAWVLMNLMLRQVALESGGRVIFLPLDEAYIDTATSYPSGLSGYSDGDFHFNSKGALKAAKYLAPILDAYLPRDIPIFPAHYHASSKTEMAAVANPLMTGSQAASLGVTGTVPGTGVKVGAAGSGSGGTASLVARTDAPGQWAQVAFTGPASPTWNVHQCYVETENTTWTNSGIGVGDYVQAFWEVDMDASPTNFGGFEIELLFYGSSGTYTRTFGNKQDGGSAIAWLGSMDQGRGILATAPTKVPVGANGSKLSVHAWPGGASAAYTVRFGRHYIRNLTASGITNFNPSVFN